LRKTTRLGETPENKCRGGVSMNERKQPIQERAKKKKNPHRKSGRALCRGQGLGVFKKGEKKKKGPPNVKVQKKKKKTSGGKKKAKSKAD